MFHELKLASRVNIFGVLDPITKCFDSSWSLEVLGVVSTFFNDTFMLYRRALAMQSMHVKASPMQSYWDTAVPSVSAVLIGQLYFLLDICKWLSSRSLLTCAGKYVYGWQRCLCDYVASRGYTSLSILK